MPPEGKYTSLPPRPQRDPYRSAPSPLTRGSPTHRLSKHSAGLPTYSAAYPDPNAKWAPKRRAFGKGKHYSDEVATIDWIDSPRVPSPPPQNPATTPLPPRVPLNQAFTMQPEHEYSTPYSRPVYGRPVENYRSTRNRDRGVPRIINSKYRDPYAAGPPPRPLDRATPVLPSGPYVEDVADYDGWEDVPARPNHSDDTSAADYDVGDPSDSASAVGRAQGRGLRRLQGYTPEAFFPRMDDDSDGDSDSDGSMNMSIPDTSRTLATSLLSHSNSGMSASHGGLSRGRQFLRPMKARRLAGVANRDTISKDNTIGDEARTADILANMGKKICKKPQ